MDILRQVVVIFCLVMALVEGNPSGPPVGSTNPDLCTNMFPAGHGNNIMVQTSNGAVNITLGNDCYKDGHTISGKFE